MMRIYQKMSLKRICLFLVTLAFAFQPLLASHHLQSYERINLVADTPGVAAQTDPRMINPWGLVFDSRGNLVVANNSSDLATSYKPDGTILDLLINVNGSPSGLERNDSRDSFLIGTGAHIHSARYLFSLESGMILAFNKDVDPENAITVVDRSAFNSVYKGIALAEVSGQQFLYATDFHNAQIDMFDSQFNFLKSFTDPTIPLGFAPFNIRNFNGRLYVTYALQKGPDQTDDQAGLGNGFVDIFTVEGVFIKRLISQGNLNSPWGLAIAPHNFGKFEGALLVGNFGDGRINAYTPRRGKFLGQLVDAEKSPIVIEGLWSLKFQKRSHRKGGQATLYFTSGPNDENNGLLGILRPAHCEN